MADTTAASSALTTGVQGSMLHMFAGQSGAEGHARLKQDNPPFSFRLGGRGSASLLPDWKRTVTSTKDLNGRVEHEIVYADPVTGMEAATTLTLFSGYPAAEWVVSFENKGTTDSPVLEDVQALDIGIVPGTPAELVRLNYLEGDICGERSFYPMRRDIGTSESMRAGQSEGRSSSGAFPFFNLQTGDFGLIAAIGWTGNWAYVIDRDGGGAVRARAGMERTHLVLHPGERIRTPRIMVMAWQGDRADAQNQWRRLVLEHSSPQVKGRAPALPVALQCFDRYVYSRSDWATEKGQLQYVEAAHRIGCDTVWLDAAWFNGAEWAKGVGNWLANKDAFPNGLKPISDAAHQQGMRFVLWFEPERVRKDSLIGRAHPEFVMWSGEQGLFKLNDPAARKWLTDLLSKRITEYGVDVYRNDFNMSPTPYWRAADVPDREGMTEIRYVEGLYAMWDDLRARHPDILIDNCASGGRRMDIEMMRRSVVLWRSDSGCSPGRAVWDQIQMCGVSQYAPLVSIASWVSKAYDMRSAATSGIALTYDYLSPNFDIEAAKSAVEEVKRNRQYCLGDFYQLTSCAAAPDEFVAWQFDRPDLGAGIVLGFRRPECSMPGIIVSPRGIDPTATYEVEFSDEARAKRSETISGKDLCAGLPLRIAERPGSLLVSYRRKN